MIADTPPCFDAPGFDAPGHVLARWQWFLQWT